MMETIAMTVMTPIMIPNRVRKLRSLLAQRAFKEMDKLSCVDMFAMSESTKGASLLFLKSEKKPWNPRVDPPGERG